MIAGLSSETALGRVASIRSETDKDVIRNFTGEQRRIYDEWRKRNVEIMNQEAFEKGMENLEMMFAAMCG